jgi:hypothetical protein
VTRTEQRTPALGSLWLGLVALLIIFAALSTGIWSLFGTRTGMRLLRGDEDRLLLRDSTGWRQVGAPHGIPYEIQMGPGGDVWVATYSPAGLSRWSGGQWQDYGSSHNPTGGFVVSGPQVWVANESGIERFDGQTWHKLPARVREPMATAAEGNEVWAINSWGDLAHCRGDDCDTHAVTNQIHDDAWTSHILGHSSRFEYNGGRGLGAKTLVRSHGRLWFIHDSAWYSSDGREWIEWQGSGDDRVWGLGYSGGRVWMKSSYSLFGIGDDLQATQFLLDPLSGPDVYRANAGDGHVVIATGNQGMFEHVGGSWRPIAVDQKLHAEAIRNVALAPDGTMWITASRLPDFKRVFAFVGFIGMLVLVLNAKGIRGKTQGASSSQPSGRKLLRFLHWVFGTIKHVQIYSPELNQRVRARYQSEINELTSLGFDYLCSDGESFSLFRLLFVIPAMILLAIWRQRMPMALQGASILVGYPVLVSRNKSTIANPDGRRLKFYTAFQDGTLLVSGNYEDPTSRGPGIVRNFRAGTISETWADHQARIQALEAEGKRVDLKNDHQAYVAMSERDTAAW